MSIIKREKYLEKIRPFYKNQLIKVLTGQRRVGKSFMLKQIRADLQKMDHGTNFIFIDKEKFEFDNIRDY